MVEGMCNWGQPAQSFVGSLSNGMNGGVKNSQNLLKKYKLGL
jgi:hypothetical protein